MTAMDKAGSGAPGTRQRRVFVCLAGCLVLALVLIVSGNGGSADARNLAFKASATQKHPSRRPPLARIVHSSLLAFYRTNSIPKPDLMSFLRNPNGYDKRLAHEIWPAQRAAVRTHFSHGPERWTLLHNVLNLRNFWPGTTITCCVRVRIVQIVSVTPKDHGYLVRARDRNSLRSDQSGAGGEWGPRFGSQERVRVLIVRDGDHWRVRRMWLSWWLSPTVYYPYAWDTR